MRRQKGLFISVLDTRQDNRVKSFLITLLLLFAPYSYSKERIVVLSPAINEIVYALGAGDEIVANTSYSTFPKESESKPKVGGYFSVSLEKIMLQKPTLVLMQRNNLSLKPKLQKLGIKVKLISISTMDDIKKAIMEISEIIDKTNRARRIIKEIDSALKSLKGIVENKKILIVFGNCFDLSDEIYVSGNNLYFQDIVKASGNKNAVASNSDKQPILSYEGVVAVNADIIYILAHDLNDARQRNQLLEVWGKLPVTAAKRGTIYINDKKYASMPSQRVVLFIEDFKRILKDAASRFR